MQTRNISYDSPFFATTILDLTKLHLYHYHYDVLKPTFLPEKVPFTMPHTDSIIFIVNCQKH